MNHEPQTPYCVCSDFEPNSLPRLIICQFRIAYVGGYYFISDIRRVITFILRVGCALASGLRLSPEGAAVTPPA